MKKPVSRGAAAAICIVLAVLVLAGVSAGLLLRDDNRGKYSPQPSAKLLEQVAESALTGKETSVSEETLNGFAAMWMEKRAPSQAKKSLKLEQAVFDLRDDGTVAAYTPVTWHGIHLGVTSLSSVTFDKERKKLLIDVKETRVGRMKVPVKSFLKRALKGRLPSGAALDGARVSVDASLFEFEPENVGAVLRVTDIRVEGGAVKILAEGDLGQAGEKLRDELSQWLGRYGEKLSGEISSYFGAGK